MCAMKKEDFLDIAPGYVGDILYEHLQLLQTDATASGVLRSRNCITPENVKSNPKSISYPSQNNNSKIGLEMSSNQITERNDQNSSTFQQEDHLQMSPPQQQHVPYPYHNLSPPIPSDGAATAAAMAAAAQTHALYNYGAGSGGAYSQGNISAPGGYDSYHQFYAAAMAATAMAAVHAGQTSGYGYPQMSTTLGRDQQYSSSHHQHHSSLHYSSLSFPVSRGPAANEGSNNTLNRCLSSPHSQPYNSSFTVSFDFLRCPYVIKYSFSGKKSTWSTIEREKFKIYA